jgi:hypothetical protein
MIAGRILAHLVRNALDRPGVCSTATVVSNFFRNSSRLWA